MTSKVQAATRPVGGGPRRRGFTAPFRLRQDQVAPGWRWSLGGGFDTAPMGKSGRSPTLPLDQQWRIGTDIQNDLTESITLGAAYEFMYGGEADLDVERGPLAGRLAGDYSSNFFNFVDATLIWRF